MVCAYVQVLGKLGIGKAFGELAILYNCKRTASVRALTNGEVWMIDRDVFQQVRKKSRLLTFYSYYYLLSGSN